MPLDVAHGGGETQRQDPAASLLALGGDASAAAASTNSHDSGGKRSGVDDDGAVATAAAAAAAAAIDAAVEGMPPIGCPQSRPQPRPQPWPLGTRTPIPIRSPPRISISILSRTSTCTRRDTGSSPLGCPGAPPPAMTSGRRCLRC